MSRFVRSTVLHKWSIPNVMFLIGAELCENKLPYAGGRFGFLEEDCLSVIEHCQQADSLLKRSIPTLGGGITLKELPSLYKKYGDDIIYFLGGQLS